MIYEYLSRLELEFFLKLLKLESKLDWLLRVLDKKIWNLFWEVLRMGSENDCCNLALTKFFGADLVLILVIILDWFLVFWLWLAWLLWFWFRLSCKFKARFSALDKVKSWWIDLCVSVLVLESYWTQSKVLELWWDFLWGLATLLWWFEPVLDSVLVLVIFAVDRLLSLSVFFRTKGIIGIKLSWDWGKRVINRGLD